MYLPSHFAEERVEVLHAALLQAGLATLVTAGPSGPGRPEGQVGPEATHLPLLLDPEPAPLGRLVGHLARANPHWRAVPEGGSAPALAMVLGPDAYVSPAWYATKAETGRVVPTWNYLAIHAHGTVRFFHDRARLLEVVTRLTDRHEAGRPHPWKVTDAPPDDVDGLLQAIVGVELTITRLEGKWKASQNKGEADRRGVEAGLRGEGHGALADVVRERGGG